MKLVLSGAIEQVVEIEDFTRDLLSIQSVLNFNLAINESTATTITELQSLYASNMQIYSVRIFAPDGHMLYNFSLENGYIHRIKDYVAPDGRRKMILTLSFDKADVGEIYN